MRRFSDAGNHDVTMRAGRPAFEKRQGTKSWREVVRGGAAGAMGIWPRREGGGGWRGAGAAIGCWQCWGEDAAELWSAGWWAPGLAAQRAVN